MAVGEVRSEVAVLAVGDEVGDEEALIASGNGQDLTVLELRIKKSKMAFIFLYFFLCLQYMKQSRHTQENADFQSFCIFALF